METHDEMFANGNAGFKIVSAQPMRESKKQLTVALSSKETENIVFLNFRAFGGEDFTRPK
jgi:hypothetical protein